MAEHWEASAAADNKMESIKKIIEIPTIFSAIFSLLFSGFSTQSLVGKVEASRPSAIFLLLNLSDK